LTLTCVLVLLKRRQIFYATVWKIVLRGAQDNFSDSWRSTVRGLGPGISCVCSVLCSVTFLARECRKFLRCGDQQTVAAPRVSFSGRVDPLRSRAAVHPPVLRASVTGIPDWRHGAHFPRHSRAIS